jgi:hypothetical protein
MSVLGMAVLTTVTGLLLAITDAVSSMVLGNSGESLARFFNYGDAAGIIKLGLFGYILIPLFIIGAILVWIELVVRSSLIYLMLAFAPMVLAVRVWPMLRGAWHHMCRIGVALIVSKFAIALSLGLGAAALGGGGPKEGDLGTQAGLTIGAVVVGASLMILAAIAPFVILKLLPVFEAAVVAQGISRGPMRAAQTGAQSAYYVQGLKRLAGGSSAAASGGGPAGAGGGGAGGGGGASGAAGLAGGGGAGGGGVPGGAAAPAAAPVGAGAASGGAAGGGAAPAGGAPAPGPAAAVAAPVAAGAAAAMVPVGVAKKAGRTASDVGDTKGSS